MDELSKVVCALGAAKVPEKSLDGDVLSIADRVAYLAAQYKALHAQFEELKRKIVSERVATAVVLGQRDAKEELLDKFAEAVAPVEVIGEHTNLNDPWKNALEMVTPAEEVAELRKRVKELEDAKELASRVLIRGSVPDSLRAGMVVSTDQGVRTLACKDSYDERFLRDTTGTAWLSSNPDGFPLAEDFIVPSGPEPVREWIHRTDHEARVKELEAPVVPKGWRVHKVCGWWTYSAVGVQELGDHYAGALPKVLRALAWAIENGEAPEHEGDLPEGEFERKGVEDHDITRPVMSKLLHDRLCHLEKAAVAFDAAYRSYHKLNAPSEWTEKDMENLRDAEGALFSCSLSVAWHSGKEYPFGLLSDNAGEEK